MQLREVRCLALIQARRGASPGSQGPVLVARIACSPQSSLELDNPQHFKKLLLLAKNVLIKLRLQRLKSQNELNAATL
jgi:hypothetical protein